MSTSPSQSCQFTGKVVLVTGAGAGLGRAYAIAFAERGASVVVNDLGTSQTGEGAAASVADKVVAEIKSKGGKAVANYDSVTEGAKIVDAAVKAFGRLDVVINNAGILRDASFLKLTDKDWSLLRQVHLNGTYAVTHAAWEIFRKQKSGAIINVTSAAGLYGNYGQAHYSAFKAGTIAFSNTLAIEGAKFNIRSNVIAPVAGSRMTATVMPEDLVQALKPEYVVPLVLYLAHESCEETGGIFEVGGGWISKVRWERASGYAHSEEKGEFTPETLARNWSLVTNFDDRTKVTHPNKGSDSFDPIIANLDRMKLSSSVTTTPASSLVPGKASGLLVASPVAGQASGWAKSATAEASSGPAVVYDKVMGYEMKPFEFTYTERDLVLYALGVGAAATHPLESDELRFTYELHPEFGPLPTFGVVPPFQSVLDVVGVPGLTFNAMMLLHGETYMEVRKPLASNAGKLVNYAKITGVYDKKSAASITLDVSTKDEAGDVVYFNSFTLFIRGIGGFGGPSGPKAPPVKVDIPKRAPDAVQEEKTMESQALLYRLAGDFNPLHADPQMAAIGGFKRPILHGLCTFGFAGRAVLKHFCNNDPARFKSIKVRFSKSVFPGETLRTEMWLTAPDTVAFVTKVVERGDEVLSQCYAKIVPETPAAKL